MPCALGLPAVWPAALTLGPAHSVRLPPEQSGLRAMRVGVALAILIGTTATALADSGPVIVIPGRPGVPIIINGIDASYAVVEGDWGLGKGVHVQPTVYGGRYVDPVPHVGHYYPSAGPHAGLRASRNRTAGQPQAAAARRELSSIMVGAVDAAAGAARSAVLSAADHLAPQNGDAGMPQDLSGRRRIFSIEDPGSFHTKTTPTKNTPQERVMRQTISGLVAAIAVMTASAAPAMACGGGLFSGSCSPCGRPMSARARRPTSRRSIPAATPAAAAGAMSGWPTRCSSIMPTRCTSITTSTRARPIPVPAPSRRIRPIRKAPYPLATAIVATPSLRLSRALPPSSRATACATATRR